MGKLSDLTTKTTPVWADLLTWLDSEDSNIQTKNKNFSLSSLWSAIFWSRTTDDIPEGTVNKFASTTNVQNAGATMNTDTDLSTKSWFLDEDDMISDDATKVPSQQSVKSYVDNQGTNINWLTEDTSPDMDNDFNVEYDVSAWINKKYKMSSYRATDIEVWEMTVSNKFIVPTQLAWESQIITRALNISSSSVTYSHSLWRKPRKIRFSFDSVWGGTGAGVYLTNDNSNRTVWDEASNSLCIDQQNVTWVVTSVTTTDYTIQWTNTLSSLATMSVLVELD